MRVVFPRLPDGTRSYSIIERRDGVRYRIWLGVAGEQLPHDLIHLVVERTMREDGGFWGAVADGAVFDSMEHLDGRRPPHTRRRSDAAIRARGKTLPRAELLADLVQDVLAAGITTRDRVTRVARERLSTLPDATVDEAAVLAAATELREAKRRWAALTPGDELVVHWPR